MTVIIDKGDWWIEVVDVTINVGAGANAYNSATVNLSKGGHCMSAQISCKDANALNTASEAGGTYSVLDQGNAVITIGKFITGIQAQLIKAATADTLVPVYRVTVIMRA